MMIDHRGSSASGAAPGPTLAERLRAGGSAVGLLVKMPNPALVEMAGWLGYDLIVIDTEHGSHDGLEHHLRAAQAAGIPAIVRVAELGPEVLRALDAGAEGVIVPHVSHPDSAENSVRAAHYPPVGDRGLAVSTRAGRQGTADVQDHLADAARTTMVIVQIEHVDALPHSAKISGTPHLSAVWLGPTDMSVSLGHPGQTGHPDVEAALAQVTSAVIANHNAALCVLVKDEADATMWALRGARIFLYAAHAVLGNTLLQLVQKTHVAIDDANAFLAHPRGSPGPRQQHGSNSNSNLMNDQDSTMMETTAHD